MCVLYVCVHNVVGRFLTSARIQLQKVNQSPYGMQKNVIVFGGYATA